MSDPQFQTLELRYLTDDLTVMVKLKIVLGLGDEFTKILSPSSQAAQMHQNWMNQSNDAEKDNMVSSEIQFQAR